MFIEGNIGVLKRIHEKQRLLDADDPRHETIRPALLIGSGVMRGVYGGGGTIALERAGLNNVFDVVVGVSTGAPLLAYFLAGQAETCGSIYWEECLTPNFFSWGRLLGGPVVDTDWLCEVFRGNISSKGIRQHQVLQSRTAFYTAATHAGTAEGVFLNAKQTPDVVEAIRASIALPGLSRGKVDIAEKSYVDGAGALPFPAPKMIREFAPTDLLVFTNRPPNLQVKKSILNSLTLEFFLAQSPRSVQHAFRTMDETTENELALTRAQTECNVLMIWADNEVDTFDKDPRKLEAAGVRARDHLTQLLNEARR